MEQPLLHHQQQEQQEPHQQPEQKSNKGLYEHVPLIVSVLFSIAIITSHGFFLYGQIAVMWRLFFRLDIDVTLMAIPGTRLHRIFKLFEIPDEIPIATSINNTIETFTYMSAIEGLWDGASQVPNPEWAGDSGPGFGGKVAAVILIVFSAIWPHVKLLSLHVMWYIRSIEVQKRSAILYWLDYGGKWSMCDVMVICLMLSVLNIDIPIGGDLLIQLVKRDINTWIETINQNDPEIKIDISRRLCQLSFLDFPDACAKATCPFPIHQTIDEMQDPIVKYSPVDPKWCPVCICIVEKSFPSIQSLLKFIVDAISQLELKGDAIGILRVAGEAGIYIFCAGVILSLLLSTFVDYLDHRVRGVRVATARSHSLLRGASFHESPMISPYQNGGGSPQLVMAVRPAGRGVQTMFMTLFKRVRIGGYQGAYSSRYIQVLSVAAMAICFIAVFAKGVFVRTVPGSISTILKQELDIELDRTYSLADLVELTGDYGGYDIFLMSIFGLFVLVGPITRAVLECVLSVTPLPPRIQIYVAFAISLLGSFSAWDVFLVALVLVYGEMPHITGMIVPPLSPPCVALANLGFGDFCLEIGLGVRWPFIMVMFGMISLTFVGVRLVRAAFIVLDPFGDPEDRGGPPLPCNLENRIFGYGRYDEYVMLESSEETASVLPSPAPPRQDSNPS